MKSSESHSNSQPLPASFSSPDEKEELRERASQQLDQVLKALKASKKILARDWEKFTPGERSAQSRVVKELEQQKQVLEEEIDMSRPTLT